MFPRDEPIEYVVVKRDSPSQQEYVPPSIPREGGLIDLENGSGIYKGYMYTLAPEQLHTVREIVIDAILKQVNALREKP